MRHRRQVSLRKQGGWSWLDLADLGLKAYNTYSAHEAGQEAKDAGNKASAAQDAALNAQTQLGYANEARSEEMFDNYMNTALPANERALSLALRPINPNTEAATAGADYSLQDSVRGQQLRRNLDRRGLGDSAAAAEGERLSLLDSTANKAAAMTTARRGATDRMIARIGNTSGLFNPLIGASSGFSASAGANLASVAAARGRQSDAATEAAGAAGNAEGQSLADVVGGFKNWWNGRNKPQSSGWDGSP